MKSKLWLGQGTYRWIVVALLWVVALLNYMDRQVITTMRPSMQGDIADLSSAESFGQLMAIFLWIYGLASPLAGFFSDRVNRKWLIVGSLFVWSAVTYFMGAAGSFQELLWLRGIMGLSEAIYVPAALTLIADYHSGRTRALAVGIHMTGIYSGQALGGFGASIAEWRTWQRAFHFFGMIGIIYAVLLIFLLREARTRDQLPSALVPEGRVQHALQSLGNLLRNGKFWVILFCFAVPSLPGWAIKNWLPTLFSEKLSLPMSTAGPLATITIAVSSLIGVICGGILSDRWNVHNRRGRVFTSAIGLALTTPALLMIGLGSSTAIIVGAAFCFGFGFGVFDANNMPIVCQFIPQGSRSTAYGIMNMSGTFAGALITFTMGVLSEQGNLGIGFAVLVIIVFAAIVLQLYTLKPAGASLADE